MIKGTIIESISKYPDSFLINKKEIIHLEVGKTHKFATGGFIKRVSENEVICDSEGDGYLDAKFTWHKSENKVKIECNASIPKENYKKVTGLCKNEKIC